MSQPTLRQVYLNRRMGVLLGLGFASGLPLMLTDASMVAWLTQAKVNVEDIGLFALVTLPYSLKFLWAPVMDRFVPPLLGRRRGWLIVTQLAVIVAIAAMALAHPAGHPLIFAALALAVAFTSASQDIVGDAYRTDILAREELGAGAAVWVNGYRIGMIVAGGLPMILAAVPGVGWRGAYFAMAACMGVGLICTVLAPEPANQQTRPESLTAAAIGPFVDFFRRTGWTGLVILLFVVLFKLPDVTCNWQTVTFLLKSGYSGTQIGLIRQWLGVGVTIVGALAGGLIVARLGIIPSLWVIGILQAASNAGFLVLALVQDRLSAAPWVTWHLGTAGSLGLSARLGALMGVIIVESFCGGLVAAGFMAYLMSQCSHRFTATQYALLTSIMALTGVLFKVPTGYVVAWTSWPTFFALTIVAGVPGLLLLIPLRQSLQAASTSAAEIK